MNKKDKNNILIIVAIILISVGVTTIFLTGEKNGEVVTQKELEDNLTEISSMDEKLVEDVELHGAFHPDETGAGDLRAVMKEESEASFGLGIAVINYSIAVYENYNSSLMDYVNETNDTYKEITNLRLEYRFGNITTEEFKTKINEYYYNGNPLLQQLIKPFD